MKAKFGVLVLQSLVGGVGAEALLAAMPPMLRGNLFDDFFGIGSMSHLPMTSGLSLSEPSVTQNEFGCEMNFDLEGIENLDKSAIEVSSCCRNLVIVEVSQSMATNDQNFETTSSTSIIRSFQLPEVCDASQGKANSNELTAKKLILNFPLATGGGRKSAATNKSKDDDSDSDDDEDEKEKKQKSQKTEKNSKVDDIPKLDSPKGDSLKTGSPEAGDSPEAGSPKAGSPESVDSPKAGSPESVDSPEAGENVQGLIESLMIQQ